MNKINTGGSRRIKMVIAVHGSPRKDGNTDILMDEFLKSIETKTPVTRFYLRNLQLNPCAACGGCDKTGVCVFKDDIWNIYERIEQADRLVISSPIFFASMTAQLKAFVDRAQPFWVRKYVMGQRSTASKKGFFISVGAMETDIYFKNARMIMKSHFNTLDIKYSGDIFHQGVDEKGAIADVPDALEKAFHAGRDFI